jgi:hypothetical protein
MMCLCAGMHACGAMLYAILTYTRLLTPFMPVTLLVRETKDLESLTALLDCSHGCMAPGYVFEYIYVCVSVYVFTYIMYMHAYMNV